ncbi:anti-anti-sigma factor [Catenuloplanes nepalensis]|uniref:Anti-anti-sigma factor n=1 Tax=Catenuloplanes nepalensis TaxID=587533 RepID=A0ABT9N6W4_9ACTN|nr:STAS domain-containing protein [Catenuloplanes nepalensis]MDP9799434.1 anti-anti-sigma factor [Catenuloplanes nepalensis]
MTDSKAHQACSRSHRPAMPGSGRPPAGETIVATVTGFHDTVIATVSRTLEFTGETADTRAPVAVVTVDGDVDRDTAPLVEQALFLAIEGCPSTWLDMHDVNFFGAAGVHMLVAAHRHATALGHTLRLRGVHGVTEQVLTIAGLDHMIPAVR